MKSWSFSGEVSGSSTDSGLLFKQTNKQTVKINPPHGEEVFLP